MSSRVHIDDPDERRELIEGRADRLELAREAGFGRVSWWSVAAGVLTSFGAGAVCVAAVAALLEALDITTNTLTDGEWTRLGLGAGVAAALVLIGCFGLGGYAAGRMARRAGVRHGLLVFVVGAVVIAGTIGIAHREGALSAIRERFADIGAPTGDSAWGGIALLTLGVALVGALAASLFGGARGERWHERLVARALDPDVGPEADLRAEVEAQRRATAKALERADKAGITEMTQELPPGVAREPSRPESEPATTGAGRSRSPSSSS